jgi:hypothetical protein
MGIVARLSHLPIVRIQLPPGQCASPPARDFASSARATDPARSPGPCRPRGSNDDIGSLAGPIPVRGGYESHRRRSGPSRQNGTRYHLLPTFLGAGRVAETISGTGAARVVPALSALYERRCANHVGPRTMCWPSDLLNSSTALLSSVLPPKGFLPPKWEDEIELVGCS